MTGGSEADVRVLLVDDEPLALDNMRIVLEHESVEIVGEVGTVRGAIDAIDSLRPDVVLLDIEMPDGSGFDVLSGISADPPPTVVFVTAHRDHAVEAFEVHAVDYVVKPFSEERLQGAVAHAATARVSQRGSEWDRLLGLLKRFEAEGDPRQDRIEPPPAESEPRDGPARRLVVAVGNGHRVIQVADLDYLTADGNYVRLHLGKEEHLVRATLAALSEKLDPGVFVRIHRSTVVNLDRVAAIEPWFAGRYVAVLKDGTRLRVSRTYRQALLRLAH